MNRDAENTNRPLALILTLVSHGILVFLFLYIYITTPIPPYPEGGGSGMGVNFGLADEGYGDEQPEKLIPIDIQEPVHDEANVTPKNVAEDNNLVTQNDEETASVKTEENENNKDVKKEENTNNATAKEEVKENKKEVNKKALFPVSDKNNNSKSQGDSKGTGDQGKPDGNPKNKFKWGQGNGEGNGNGVGNGTGDGHGDGDGPGNNKKGNKNDKDKGVSFNLTGRRAENLPTPSYDDNDEGKVVVEVIVDRDGKVTKATEGKGSTTSSSTLKKAAINAAKKAKFSKNPDAAEFQKGTITYHFKQQ